MPQRPIYNPPVIGRQTPGKRPGATPLSLAFRHRIGGLLHARAPRHLRLAWAWIMDLSEWGVSLRTKTPPPVSPRTLATMCAIAADKDPEVSDPMLRLFLSALYPKAPSGTSFSTSSRRSTSRL